MSDAERGDGELRVHEPVERDVRNKTLAGLGWSGVGHLIQQTASFGISILLARLLEPSVFGTVAMVYVVTGFAALFEDVGLGAALVQRKEIEERHTVSVFWLCVAVGALLSLINFFAAPAVAAFYETPLLTPLMQLLSVCFFINALGVVPRSLHSRDMNLRALVLTQIVGVLFGGGVAVFLALSGFGPWSLVWQTVVCATTTGVGLWVTCQWRPRFSFDLAALKDVLGMGTSLTGFRALNYWGNNVDNLLIGKYLGSAELGVYGRAYNLMMLPVFQVHQVISRVMFPALSSIQEDKERVKRIYLRAIAAIALVTFPMLGGLLVVARPFVLFVFGEKWAAMIPVLQILCVVGMSRSIDTTLGWLYMSQGRTGLQMKWGSVEVALKIAAIVVGLRWGIEGVALSYTIVTVIFLKYPSYTIPGRLVGLRFHEVVRAVGGVLVCTIIMGGLVAGVDVVLPSDFPLAAILGIEVLTGVVVYVGLVHMLRLPPYLDLRQLLLEALMRRRAARPCR